MQIYLVGGTVRDKLLGISTKDRDWLVIGESPESMRQKGFRAVGKDFPVFLHPETKEEYALARTERKTAPGYKGFAVHSTPDVTLEQDLIRRDLTINAMAMTPDGQLIDPFHGQQDLKNRIFRHISPAFAEDPVRILRVARFAARYQHLGFTLAEETRELMTAMIHAGEADYLVPERVWAELFKALQEPSPSAFFYTLQACQGLERLFPEIHDLFGVPQPAQYHPEIDTGVHTLLCVDQAAKLSDKPAVRFAALVHDLGKALSPPQYWPHHHGHERKGLPVLEKFCNRLRVPNDFKHLARLVMEFHTHCHKVYELKPATLVDLLTRLNAYNPDNSVLNDFMLACTADARGRTGFEQTPYLQSQFLYNAAQAAINIDTSAILASELKGAQIGEAIKQLRIKAVSHYKNTCLPASYI